MHIKVLLFAMLREKFGKSEIDLELSEGCRAGDVLNHLYKDDRAAADKMKVALLFAVNQTYASSEASIQDGDEVALIPPVAGG